MVTPATPEQLPGNRPLKAKSASLSLYHMDPGHHREASRWHDADHKAEVIGSAADIFISQRWVTPPDWIDLRPKSDLPEGGGEYVNLYWSAATPDELSATFQALGTDLASVGRMDTVRYMHRVWPNAGVGNKLVPAWLTTRPGYTVSAAAVTASTNMTGLVTIVGSGAAGEDFHRWHEGEYLPKVLETGLFAGAAKLAPEEANEAGVYLTLLYLDTDSPADAYVEYREKLASWTSESKGAPDSWAGHATVFESLAAPSIGHYDYYE